MTYLITKAPHPLDLIWSGLPDSVDDAFEAVESAPEGSTQEHIDALVDYAHARLAAMLALPARNVGDVLTKLNCLFDKNGRQVMTLNMNVIIDEFCDVLDAGIQAGKARAAEEEGS